MNPQTAEAWLRKGTREPTPKDKYFLTKLSHGI